MCPLNGNRKVAGCPTGGGQRQSFGRNRQQVGTVVAERIRRRMHDIRVRDASALLLQLLALLGAAAVGRCVCVRIGGGGSGGSGPSRIAGAATGRRDRTGLAQPQRVRIAKRVQQHRRGVQIGGGGAGGGSVMLVRMAMPVAVVVTVRLMMRLVLQIASGLRCVGERRLAGGGGRRGRAMVLRMEGRLVRRLVRLLRLRVGHQGIVGACGGRWGRGGGMGEVF